MKKSGADNPNPNESSPPAGMGRTDSSPSAEGELTLHDFFHILQKRYLIFALTMALVTIGGVVITLSLQPVFQSTATISVERPPPTAEWQLYTGEQDDKSVLQLLNSPSLLAEAVELAGVASSAMRDLKLVARTQKESPLVDIVIEDVLPHRLMTIFQNYLSLAAERLSKNEGQNLVRKVDFIRSQLKLVEERIQKTDKTLQAFAQKEEDISVTDKANKVNDDIQKLKDERRNGEGELAVIGNLLKDLQERAVSVSKSSDRPLDTTLQELVELKTSLFQLERERIKLLSMYKEAHPDIKSVDDQISYVNDQIMKKSRSVGTSSLLLDSTGQVGAYVFQRLIDLEQQQKTLTLRIAQMDLALAEKQTVFKGLLSRMEEYGQLSRRQKVDEQIHTSLIEKLNQAEVDKGTLTVTVKVVSAPIEPNSPNRPQYPRYVLFSVILGLFAGCLLAYLQENMDNSLKSTEDAQAFLGLVNLGSIPDLKALLKAPVLDPKVEISPSVVTFHQRATPESEAFRTLRTTLMYKAQQTPFKTLLVTSWGRNLGKSTVSTNLAMAYAQSGMKVILVDGDLHKPTLHQYFFLNNHRGLTDFILGDHLDKVLRPTAQPNLFVIPSGPLPPNPSEILGSQGMEVAIKHLVAAADLVIFDMPPLMAVADAAVLAGKVDAVLYLVPIGKESRRFAAKGLELLRLVKAPIIGMVCTFLKRHEFEGYAYHYHV